MEQAATVPEATTPGYLYCGSLSTSGFRTGPPDRANDYTKKEEYKQIGQDQYRFGGGDSRHDKNLSTGSAKAEAKAEVDDSAFAKLAEEMKALPSRVAERLTEGGDFFRRRRMRRFHPMMLEEFVHGAFDPGDPVSILLAASLVRDEIPWLYEVAMEVYRAVKAGDREGMEREMARLRRLSERVFRGPFMEELGFASKESHLFAMEFPRMLEHILIRTLEAKEIRPGKTRSRKDLTASNTAG